MRWSKAIASVLAGLAIMGAMAVAWVFLAPLYAAAWSVLLRPFTPNSLTLSISDANLVLTTTDALLPSHQTSVYFHAFLLAYGYLVAAGLCVVDFRASVMARLRFLAISYALLFFAHGVGLYAAAAYAQSWLGSPRSSQEVYGFLTTLTLAWALLPAALWVLWSLRRRFQQAVVPRLQHR
ncbi:MAG: hypothetical protein HY683_04060 [Chloroflexi bacterium]|nr:hypothetical protein [Chloroflexota bacterium]